MSLCLFRSIEPKISINWKLWIRFLKEQILTCSNSLFKSFSNFSLSLSLRLGQGFASIFCRFPPIFLQGFPLPRPVRPLYPYFCIYFHVSCINSSIILGFSNLCIFWGFWWFKRYFVKLIIGFLSYNVINMIYDVQFDQFGDLWEFEYSRAWIYLNWGLCANWV